MRKLFVLFATVMAMAVSSCSKFDDTPIWDKINDHEQRISKLEELCQQMNSNISSLQTIVTALQNNDYVTAVTPVTKDGKTIGYTITFTKSAPITIYHGEDGKDGINGSNGKDGVDGYTPIIGVKQDVDGIYYWTIDGEWLTDYNGNKIKAVGTDGKDGANGADGKDGANGNDGANGTDGANGVDGITPQLKIENDYWYVSYDNGSTWVELGKATGEDGADGKDGIDGTNGADGKDGVDGANGKDGDSFFKSVDTSDSDYVVFTLADGTVIKLPTWYAFEQLKVLCNQMNTNISALYTIVNALHNNDYVESITPLMDNGKEIGYTIKFTKSGTITIYHGQNGSNGVDGSNGIDGYTPTIGVKKDTDGIYYWTIDGDWLTDESGNKVKANGIDGKDGQNGTDGKDGQDGANGTDGKDGVDGANGADGSNGQNGVDGKDGITPQLKIENGYWYVSYNGGTSWAELGKATGDNGKDGQNGSDGANGQDGKDGDSFFKTIDTSDVNYVVFTLADGSQIKVPTWYAFEQLQILCNQMNTNIDALQTIVNALQNNDYVESITPLMENGKAIGYTIKFTKSGTITIYHGKDGANGVDGANGIDGTTPVIGVKQDKNGEYYWTINGQWLLDENSDKIKAVGADGKDGVDGTNGADGKDGQDGANGADGKDGVDGTNGTDGKDGQNGKDGITPKLKIENGYWYVSYDNETTWVEVGKATGENGKDGQNGSDGANGQNGKDGDSFFQSVTQDENNAYFTLSDGTQITIPLATSYLFNRLQSVTYIPKYSDGMACTKNGVVELDFHVSPKSAVVDIANNWQSILSLKATYTITRAVSYIDMPIVSCEADVTNGTLTVVASDENLSEEFNIGTQTANVVLHISDGNIDITSDYVAITPYHPYNEIWYTTRDGNAIALYNSDNMGANVVSSTYTSGKGIIKFDGAVKTIGSTTFAYGGVTDAQKTIKTIILPETITQIDSGAFNNISHLESIYIGRDINTIGNKILYGRTSCKTVYINAVTPPSLGAGAFYYQYYDKNDVSHTEIIANITIYVPAESLTLYKNADEWKKYADHIVGYDFNE